MTTRRLLVACLLCMPLVVGPVAAGCGSDTTDTASDAGDDGTTLDGTTGDDGGPGNGDGAGGGDGANAGDAGPGFGNDGGWFGNDSGACSPLGQGCTKPSDCCTGVCTKGSCQPPACTSDGQGCTMNSQCCSGTCGASGTCTSLNNACKTLGNACKDNAECCSKLCLNGTCGAASYCGQFGDICLTGADCCGGICTKANGAAFGTCAQPPSGGAQCSMVDGVVCDNGLPDGGFKLNDAGLPECGGPCCSRSCAPWGPTGILICQPASGCRPVGDICAKDSDCCGGPGVPGPTPNGGPTRCDISPPNVLGVCHNPTGCKPNGDICRLPTVQCNADDDCCSGRGQPRNPCKQDILGIPRCADVQCVDAGNPCATSADCCAPDGGAGIPCVPNPNYVPDGGAPEFVCSASACVPTSGLCTTDADCCKGNFCHIPPGGSKGTCNPLSPPGADGGGTCSLYGQQCNTNSDCCNGVPCINGRCISP